MQIPADFPAVLAHAESQAAAADLEEFGLWINSTSHQAIDYLLMYSYRVGRIVAAMFSDVPFGCLGHFINTDPPFPL